MAKAIYLINPACDFPTYFGAEVYAANGFRPVTLMADLAVVTLAAMAPSDFEVRLCDENISPVDFDCAPDWVGITGKITQWGHMRNIAREFRRRGKIVVIGGPYASLCPAVVRPYCDILVRGEVEDIAEELFSDLRGGGWKTEYVGSRPDLSHSPRPRWDLYPNERALSGTVQTSRGCPFECEFCDVIQYLGRKQRHKPVEQVLGELDALYRIGHRFVFLADDNFTAYRGRAKELLAALRDWNSRRDRGEIGFATQVSIDAAKDEELLELCAEAGLTHVFIGIETPNEDSLRETKKHQNLRINLADQVQRFLDHGIAVTAGMIVGFDSDGPDIFDRQYEFAMSTPIPIFSLGALVAPAATPLHERMAGEGRLVSGGSEVAAAPWNTNIVPRQMTGEQLLEGIQGLCNKLYQPSAFGERVLRFMAALGGRGGPRRAKAKRDPGGDLRTVDHDSLALLSKLERFGPQEREMWSRITRELYKKPELLGFVMGSLLQYMQIRYMYEQGRFWESHPA